MCSGELSGINSDLQSCLLTPLTSRNRLVRLENRQLQTLLGSGSWRRLEILNAVIEIKTYALSKSVHIQAELCTEQWSRYVASVDLRKILKCSV